ncbi:MAG: NAD(P)-dependent glycerol-3-phosphate dehydrogenase [Planctomycetes bacterium]|nr:NAD(P)-dependent glycerol-3-phosphate dehydrogenase [Planctomycetota bacterium]
MAKHAAIIGDGAMGTLCSMLLAHNGYACAMWSAFEEHAADMTRTGENKRFLPGFRLPKGLTVSTDAAEAAAGADLVVIAVPSRHLRGVLARVKDALPPEAVHVSVVKGIESGTLLRPSEIVAQVVGRRRLAVLSGPCLSREVAERLPATVVAASRDAQAAVLAQAAFATPYFRIYTNDDAAGVELGGALKNVIAIAAGICDGLGLGSNALAALVTRGLVEMTRLGAAMGARRETFAGLAGLGDLVTTCVSNLSRNRRVGREIGRGRHLKDVLREMGRVEAEGVETTRSAAALAARHNVEMPITQEVYAVLFEGKPAPDALADLMSRSPKKEST